MIDINDDRRLKIVAPRKISWLFATANYFGTHLTNLIKFVLYFLTLRGGDHGTEIDVRAHRISDPESSGEFYKSIDEFVGDGIKNIETFAGSAHLAHVQISSPDRAPDRHF